MGNVYGTDYKSAPATASSARPNPRQRSLMFLYEYKSVPVMGTMNTN